jgi:hypothetical protein
MPSTFKGTTFNLHVLLRLFQYVKEETLTIGDSGKEARASRLITERASRRIGQMAFNIALARPRKVRGLQHLIQEYL